MITETKRIRLGDLRLLEINARYMRHEQFKTLVDNVRRDGTLTSTPFAVKDDDAYLVLSGNHRVKAAIEALGEDAEIDVLTTDEDLPREQRVAIQLSHNAIAGEDDPAILKNLYDELDEIVWRDYSGLDDKTLDLLAEVGTKPIAGAARLDFLTVVLLLLPDERERLEAAIAEARAAVKGDAVLAGRMAEYDRILDALDTAGRSWAVTNAATSLMLILDIFERHIGELAEGWRRDEKRKRWVSLSTIFGTPDVPPDVGRVLLRAISTMTDAGDVSDAAPWQALEYWAADYLAGAKEEA